MTFLLIALACDHERSPAHADSGGADDSATPAPDSGADDSGDTTTPPPAPTTVRLAEIVSSPSDPKAPDWVELWNDGTEEVALGGWFLTDRAGERFALSGTLAADGRLVLTSDALGFGLDKDGDSLTLRAPGDAVVQSIAFGRLLPGMSLAWIDAGWAIDLAPTPGEPTSTAVRGTATAAGACAPSIVAVPAQPEEGESVAMRVACGGDAPADDRGVLWVPSIDSTGDAAGTWTPALDEAGHHVFFAATWTADPEVPPETTVLDLDVADAWDDPKNVPVDPTTYTDEWGIPVLHLSTKESLGGDYVPATTVFGGATYAMEAKYRGAASYGYPEKSFTLRFDDKDKIDLEDQGMGHRDHLVLVTTFDDNSLLRQKLVYDLWAALAEDAGATGRLVPRSFFVVLYIDGSYFGLYLAIDHIDDEFARDMGYTGDGNMYKAVDHNGNFYRTSVYGGTKSTLHDGYEKKEGLPADDFSDLESLVAFSADSDDDTFRKEAPDWIAVDEFTDWLFLVLYTSAYDSGGKNSYLYDDAPGTDIEFHFAPWDMNESFGQGWQTDRLDASASLSRWRGVNGIFAHLIDQPDSAAEIEARALHLLDDGPLERASVDARIDALTAQLGRHLDRSWAKWGDDYRTYGGWSWRDDFTTPEDEVDYIRDWLDDHDAAMRAIWGL